MSSLNGATNSTYVLYCDGGARGNPGPAAAAALLYHGDTLIAQSSAYLGDTTNNVAEYRSLIMGLELAKDRGITALLCYMDSKLIVEQVQGRYKIKAPHLKLLAESAIVCTRKFSTFSLQHRAREKNKRADDAVNDILDAWHQ